LPPEGKPLTENIESKLNDTPSPEEEPTARFAPGGGGGGTAGETDVTQLLDPQPGSAGGSPASHGTDGEVAATMQEIPAAAAATPARDTNAASAKPSTASTSPPAPASKAPPTDEPSDRRYQFLDKLGEGGMGMVYKAEDMMLNRIVAIKLLKLTGHNHN